MPLALVRRGNTWHIRDTIRWGDVSVRVRETTGRTRREEAEKVAAARERQLLAELAAGHDPAARRRAPAEPTFADAALSYLKRPQPVHPNDEARIALFNEAIGDLALSAIDRDAWADLCAEHLEGRAAPTLNRYRATLMAVLHHADPGRRWDIPKVPEEETAPRYLAPEEADRVVWHAAPHYVPLATTLRYQGLRTSEALRLEVRHVDFAAGHLVVERSKSRRIRIVPLHPEAVVALRHAIGGRRVGRVFLTHEGEPYTVERHGSNPIRTAHYGACRRAEVEGFTPHDWRSHWASWFIMSGGDVPTLMKLGGWKDARMVKRYADLNLDHARAQLHRVA